MKDILISLLVLLVIIVVRGSYAYKSEIDRVPYYTLDFDTMEEQINPDEEIFFDYSL